MTQTPARILTDSNVFQNISSISSDSFLKTEENYTSSKMKLPFSNVRTHSNDDFSKSKIMELQEELLKLRKQLSQRDCNHSKQKSTLLSRIEILTEENTQIKHRQQSLQQLNHTLELALNTQEQTKVNITQKESTQLQVRKEDLEKKDRTIKDLRKTIEEYKTHIRRIDQEKYKLLEAKDHKINDLSSKNNELLVQKEEQQNKIKLLLNPKYCNKDLVNSIYKALNIHIAEKDWSFEDIQVQSNCFDESPIPKRGGNYFSKKPTERRSNGMDTSYSRVSGHSFINDLSSNQYIPSQYSDYEEPERLLCEVCKKVYDQQQFIRHMPQCQEITQLHQQRQKLQKAIYEIDSQRPSISQRKTNGRQVEQREPLKPLINKDKSTSRLKGRDISIGENQPNNKQKKMKHLTPTPFQQNQQRYYSRNFY